MTLRRRMLDLAYLRDLHDRFAPQFSAAVREFTLGSKRFQFNSRPALMGVINLSADSWYRESVALSREQAVQRGRILAAQGADILDIGAESTLGQAGRADAATQRSKLLPVIAELTGEGLLVSVETYEPDVARACLEAGARIINLTGRRGSAEIYANAAAHGAAVIICYVQGPNVREVGTFDFSRDPIELMEEYFKIETEKAARCGLDKLFLDPGLGFYYANLQDSAKRVQHQAAIFLHSFRLRSLGFPICQALPHAFEFFGEEVRSAESFFAVLAALGRTDLFRTHEVPRVKAVLETMRVIGPGAHGQS